jgi:hypothetical protein
LLIAWFGPVALRGAIPDAVIDRINNTPMDVFPKAGVAERLR